MGWINVNERLPEITSLWEEFIVCTHNKWVTALYYHRDSKKWFDIDYYSGDIITHSDTNPVEYWQPLPIPKN